MCLVDPSVLPKYFTFIKCINHIIFDIVCSIAMPICQTFLCSCFQVTLPTGAYVKVVNSYEDYVNVWFVPASSDYNNTEGKSGD